MDGRKRNLRNCQLPSVLFVCEDIKPEKCIGNCKFASSGCYSLTHTLICALPLFSFLKQRSNRNRFLFVMAGKPNRRSGKSNWPNVNRWKVFNEARGQARQVRRNAAAANVDQSDVGHVADGGASTDVVPGCGGVDQNCHRAVAAWPCIGMGPDVDNVDLHVPVDGEVPETQTSSGAETSTKPGAPGKSTKKRRRFSFKEVSQKLRFYVLEHSINDYRASSKDSSDDTLEDDWSQVPRVGGLLIGGRYFSRAKRVMDPVLEDDSEAEFR